MLNPFVDSNTFIPISRSDFAHLETVNRNLLVSVESKADSYSMLAGTIGSEVTIGTLVLSGMEILFHEIPSLSVKGLISSIINL